MLLNSRQLLKACTSIGDEATDDDGFVSVQALINRFNAKLLLRPLLVEGMIAELTDDADADWGVIIDNERYPVTYASVENERKGASLPSRMRYTVAHELVHSLGFRSTEFGIHLETRKQKRQSQRSFIQLIEQQTDSLSPFLLCSEKSIDRMLLRIPKDSLSASDIASLCKSYGLSRYVFTNRLRLLPLGHHQRLNPALRNLGIAIATRKRDGGFQFRGWPVFTNFDRNITPTFLLELLQKRSLPVKQVVSDNSFSLNEGRDSVVQFEGTAGTPALPTAESMSVRITAEDFAGPSQSSVVVTIEAI